jgi:hypothetical protein
MTKKILLLPITALLLTACGKDDKDRGPFKTAVALEETASADGCLSLPNYFQGVRAMDPSMPVMEVTTSLETKSKYAVRENYKRLLAYGSAHAEAKPLAELQDFQNVSQDACSSLTVNAPDGATETLPIVNSSKESLRAENDDGLGFEYTWLSPTRMRVTHRYRAYDLPCGTDTPIIVVHTKELDWSGSAPDAVEIDSSVVRNVAETVGADPSEAAAGDGKTSVARLKELLNRDPRPELLTCNGQAAPPPGPAPAPAPAPTPDPNENPTDPGSTPTPTPAPAPEPAPAPTPENPNPTEEGTAPGPITPTPAPSEGGRSDSPWWWPF